MSFAASEAEKLPNRSSDVRDVNKLTFIDPKPVFSNMTRLAESKQLIENTVSFLKNHVPLSDGHMVDYFTKSLYRKSVPPGIRREISDKGYNETIALILDDETSQLPLLHEFISSAKKLSLYNAKNLCLSLSEFREKLEELSGEEAIGLKMDVFMKSKKAHEVEILSGVAALVAKISGTSHLVDIGDGKGYLSSLLALHHQLPVLGVDACPVNTTSAIKRAAKLEKYWHNILKIPKDAKEFRMLYDNSRLYKQVTRVVTEDTNFDELVTSAFQQRCVGIGLVGLHTCGNLGPTSVRLFCSKETVRSLCNVSCCYHLLNEKYLPNTNKLLESCDGFPMSSHLLDRELKLGRAARMLSAQSVDRILGNRDLPNKVIFYRAVLEVILDAHHPTTAERTVGRYRKEPENFVGYSREAFRRIGVSSTVTDDCLEETYESFVDQRSQLNVFHLLRSMLAPAIESLILLDRYVYLLEQGHENVFLVQLFDPLISPRCYGLFAFKS